MPENARQIHARAANALRSPSVQDWATWPFDGPVIPRALAEPCPEPERDGEDRAGCTACAKPDEDYLWTDERWRLMAFPPEWPAARPHPRAARALRRPS